MGHDVQVWYRVQKKPQEWHKKHTALETHIETSDHIPRLPVCSCIVTKYGFWYHVYSYQLGNKSSQIIFPDIGDATMYTTPRMSWLPGQTYIHVHCKMGD